MRKQSRTDAIRQTIAGWLFLLAGRIHRSYDVWLDDAPRRGSARKDLDHV